MRSGNGIKWCGAGRRGSNGTLWVGMQQLNNPAWISWLVATLDHQTGKMLGTCQ